MNQQILDEVMLFLVPQFKFMSSLIVGHNLTELGLIKERINKGLKKDYITFYPEEKNLDLDIKKIEKEKGKEWTKTLKKQLKAFVEIIEKFEESK